MMQSPLPSFIICLAYFIFVWMGPWLMEGRKPVEMRNVLLMYNIAMMARVCWWFYFSKFIELLDTVFFILRKKFNQVSFLHVFHHGIMPISWWFGVKLVPGGFGTFHSLLNSFIHLMMYTYYGLSALGPAFSRFLWWKKYMTSMQITQFVLVTIHSVQLLFIECDYPVFFVYWIGLYAVVFLVLFAHFYIQTYTKAKAARAKKSDGVETKRPDDYFAEMAKPDSHMHKVREKLNEKKTAMERSEAAKKLREQKKYGKKVLELCNKSKLNEFLGEGQATKQSDAKSKPRKKSRDFRNKKYGFGGQKKRSKRNTKESFEATGGAKKEVQVEERKVLYPKEAKNLFRAVRKISKIPFKVLDAPELQDDFYLNLVTRLCDLSADGDTVTSVSWSERGSQVAVGTHKGLVQIWDVSVNKKITTLEGHGARVGQPLQCVDTGSQVCNLAWSKHSNELAMSPDGEAIVTGAGDETLRFWNVFSKTRSTKQHLDYLNAAVLRRQVKWRSSGLFFGLQFCVAVQEGSNVPNVTRCACDVQWRPPVPILDLSASAVLEQHSHSFNTTN
nr:hypothetical protein BaRGS_029853 [Batillaria attramentaria]